MLKRRIIRINQNHSRVFSTYTNNLLSMLECNTNIEKLIKIPIHPPYDVISRVSKRVVRQLADTFNDPQRRELSYFDFYHKSLTFHDYPPNQTANKEGFKQFIYLLWKAFPDIIITFEEIIIEGNKVACRYNLSTKVNLRIFFQPINNLESMV